MNRWGQSRNPETDLTTDDLISAVLEGRAEAYADIVGRYQHSVLRVVNTMLYDRSSTEDLVQQVFINAYRALDRFETGKDFGSWIRVIARNVVREELRRSIRYDTHLNAYADQLTERWVDDECADKAEAELDSSLEECLKKLAERTAKIVNFGYYEDWSCDRIAQEMKIPDGGLRLRDSAILSSAKPAKKSIDACRKSGELTVEAWVKPTKASQSGPARIATSSSDRSNCNFTLGHGGDDEQVTEANERSVFIGRVRTSITSGNGIPELHSDNNFVAADMAHVVDTRSADGQHHLYFNGIERANDERHTGE